MNKNKFVNKRPLYLVLSYAFAIVFVFVLKYFTKSMNIPASHPYFVIPFLLIPGNCIISFFWFSISMVTANYPKHRQVLHALLIVMWVVIFIVISVDSIYSVLG